MTEQLQKLTDKHCENPPAKYDDLKALFLKLYLEQDSCAFSY